MKKNRKAQLAYNTVILTIGKICTQCISFFLLPLYTSLLKPGDYGAVDLISTYAALLLPLCNWQMEMGLFRFMLDVRESKEEQKRMISTVTSVNLLQIIIFLVIFFIVGHFINLQYKVFLAIQVVLNIFLGTMLQAARGFGRNDVYAVASFLSASLYVTFNVVFIAVLHMGAVGMFMGMIVSNIISIGYLFFSLKYYKYYDIQRFDKILFKHMISYSLPLVPNQLSWWVVGASDRIVISNFISVAMNGVYSVANKFSSMYITFYNIFNLAWTESCAVYINDEDCNQYLSEVIETMFTLFSAVCIGIMACMPFIFPIMINNRYSTAYQQIPILLMAVLCQSIVGLISVVYTAKKLSKILAKTSFWIAVINLSTDLILIRYIGLYAASVSTLLAYAVMMVYRWFDVKKYVNIKISSKKIYKTFLLASGVMYSYYRKSVIFHIIALIITIMYAIFENKEFLFKILEMSKVKLAERKKK
mgnify:CR=1 FL=1